MNRPIGFERIADVLLFRDKEDVQHDELPCQHGDDEPPSSVTL